MDCSSFAPSLFLLIVITSTTMDPQQCSMFTFICDQGLIDLVIDFLGAKLSFQILSALNKKCVDIVANHHSFPNSEVIGGRLVESSGRQLCGILELLRYACLDLHLVTISPQARSIVKSSDDLYHLRQRHLFSDLMMLDNGMYSYWTCRWR